MTDDAKLPTSLTIATTVLPPEQQEDLSKVDLMELVRRMNCAHAQMNQVIAESGNGVRFRETRDLVLRDLALGKKF